MHTCTFFCLRSVGSNYFLLTKSLTLKDEVAKKEIKINEYKIQVLITMFIFMNIPVGKPSFSEAYFLLYIGIMLNVLAP